MFAFTPVIYFAFFLGIISNYEGKVLKVSTTGPHTLNRLLCDKEGHKKITNNTEIRFDPSINYNLSMSPGSFCLVENVSNLTLSGSRDKNTFSNITCVSVNHTQHTTGFGFINIHNLTIKNLHIKNCASNPLVSKAKLEFTNQISLSNNATTLLLSQCHHVRIQRTQISTRNSSFLVVEEVKGETLIEDFNARWLCKSGGCQRSVHPTNKPPQAADIPSTKLQFPQLLKSSASAVIVVIINTSVDINVNFQKCKLLLHCCSSSQRPKVGFVHLNVSTASHKTAINFSTVHFIDTTIFTNLYFNNTSIQDFVIEPFQLHDCNFSIQHEISPFKLQWNMIVLHSETQPIQIKIDQVRLVNSPMFIYSGNQKSNTSVIITNITTSTSLPNAYSTLYLIFLRSVELSGSQCILERNFWSAIVLVESELHLNGKIMFKGNHAPIGGAIYSENSLLFFDQEARVKFVGNKADLIGGAIYATNSRSLHNPLGENLCTLQFMTKCYNDQSNLDAVHFRNNTASIMGSALFASPLYYCYQQNDRVHQCQCHLHDKLINQVEPFQDSNVNPVSSNSFWIKPCDGQDHKSNRTVVYPGGTLEVNVRSTDLCNNPVPALIHAEVDQLTPSSTFKVFLEEDAGGSTQGTSAQNCSRLKYTFLVRNKTANATLKESIKLRLLLQFGLSMISLPYPLEVEVAPCPTGFQLSPGEQKCNCSSFLSHHSFTCNITTVTFNRSDISHSGDLGWLGRIPDNPSKLAFTDICCHGYCDPTPNYNLSQPDSICINNRGGFVCGQCRKNFSVVLGPRGCYICHGKYFPLILIVFLLGGIVFVLFLWALQLTVDKGTLSSLAFCASVFTTVIRTDSQTTKESNYSVFLETVLSLLSLRYNSQYHICLWNGMTNLQLTVVNFGVPVYLWVVIIVIIFCARHSSTVSHFMFKSSVQVLTTLLHLSYSSMTLTFFYTISYVYVHTEEGSQLGWFFDANVKYGKDLCHCTLLIIAIMFYLFFILPYTIVGTFGSCILRYHWIHSYFRPFIDTMHAPYRHNKTYWFGLRLLLLQVLFTIYVFIQYNKQILVYAIILIIFLTVQIINKPYKTKLVSLVDSMSMLFLVVCLVLQVHSKRKEDLSTAQMAFMTLLFLIFLFTIITHIVMVLNIDLTHVRCYMTLNRWFCSLKNWHWFNREGYTYEPVEESDTEDSVRLRESLLAY